MSLLKDKLFTDKQHMVRLKAEICSLKHRLYGSVLNFILSEYINCKRFFLWIVSASCGTCIGAEYNLTLFDSTFFIHRNILSKDVSQLIYFSHFKLTHFIIIFTVSIHVHVQFSIGICIHVIWRKWILHFGAIHTFGKFLSSADDSIK